VALSSFAAILIPPRRNPVESLLRMISMFFVKPAPLLGATIFGKFDVSSPA
jgi:hypothetical protein